MANMQIDLFRALRSIGVNQDAAQSVVEVLEGHIAMQVKEATRGIQEQLKVTNILLGFVGLMSTAAVGLGSYLAIISK